MVFGRFVVGMQSGQVVRRSRFDKGSGRMAYQRDQGSGSGDALAGVVCLDFHPFESDYFLVGYEDGRIWYVEYHWSSEGPSDSLYAK